MSKSPKSAWKLQKQRFSEQNSVGHVNLQGRVGKPIFWFARGSPSLPTTKGNLAVLKIYIFVKLILAVGDMILHLTNKNSKLQKRPFNSDRET